MSSDALNPDPVTELPLTPPAEEEDEDAAILAQKPSLETEKNVHSVYNLRGCWWRTHAAVCLLKVDIFTSYNNITLAYQLAQV